jgi:hypothetical protein
VFVYYWFSHFVASAIPAGCFRPVELPDMVLKGMGMPLAVLEKNTMKLLG